MEILTGAVPGDDLQGDRVESFSTISKSCNTDTFIPKKKKKSFFWPIYFILVTGSSKTSGPPVSVCWHPIPVNSEHSSENDLSMLVSSSG